MMSKIDKQKQGKKNKEAGNRFERKVRLDLETNDYIVSRWQNNVEFMCTNNKKCCGKLIPAKHKFRGIGIPMVIGTGFPDFIAYQFVHSHIIGKIKEGRDEQKTYHIVGVECKSNGYLDKEEKEKCDWLLDNNVFSKILIAKKGEKRGEIIYEEFKNIV